MSIPGQVAPSPGKRKSQYRPVGNRYTGGTELYAGGGLLSRGDRKINVMYKLPLSE